METLLRNENGTIKMETIDLLLRWDLKNNKIGLRSSNKEAELIQLIDAGLDPFEFISVEDLKLTDEIPTPPHVQIVKDMNTIMAHFDPRHPINICES